MESTGSKFKVGKKKNLFVEHVNSLPQDIIETMRLGSNLGTFFSCVWWSTEHNTRS